MKSNYCLGGVGNGYVFEILIEQGFYFDNLTLGGVFKPISYLAHFGLIVHFIWKSLQKDCKKFNCSTSDK